MKYIPIVTTLLVIVAYGELGSSWSANTGMAVFFFLLGQALVILGALTNERTVVYVSSVLASIVIMAISGDVGHAFATAVAVFVFGEIALYSNVLDAGEVIVQKKRNEPARRQTRPARARQRTAVPQPVIRDPNWTNAFTKQSHKTWLDMAQANYGKRPFLLGYGNGDTPVHIDLESRPHHLVGGMTGNGKTSSLVRPIAAMAAASGAYQVLIIDTSGKNFRLMSDNHKNIHTLVLPHNRYDEALNAVFAEIERRNRWLAGLDGYITELREVPEAQRPPSVLVVIDEYSNAYESNREIIEAPTNQIVREGRSVGVHLMVVAQRLTADGVGTTTRSQMNIVTFCTNPNEERYALPGSSSLAKGEAVVAWDSGAGAVRCLHATKQMIVDYLDNAPSVSDYGFPIWLPRGLHENVLGYRVSPEREYPQKPIRVSAGISSQPIPDTGIDTRIGSGISRESVGNQSGISRESVPEAFKPLQIVPNELKHIPYGLDRINEIAELALQGLSNNEVRRKVGGKNDYIQAICNYVKELGE